MRKGADFRINRRILLAGASAALGLATVPFGRLRALESCLEGPVVDTTDGKLRGLLDRQILLFRGIPYGAPTGDANRFLAPKKPAPWKHIREAFAFGNSAPQTDPDGKPWSSAYDTTEGATEELLDRSRDPEGVAESEDCLYLNVTTPSLERTARKPVMVWLHGGGYFLGSASWDLYRTDNLARNHDVVVVGINHRLNAFGFLYLGGVLGSEFANSGNIGQLDIVQALQWVRDNIASFGGDPGNVTVFGESGGGTKVSMLMAMRSARGLFHRAIIESGASLKVGTLEDARKATDVLLAELGLKSPTLRQLQDLPPRRLLSAYFSTMAKIWMVPPSGHGENFGPIVDGVVLTRQPFDPDAPPEAAAVPLIVGFNRTETTMGQAKMLLAMDEATLRQRLLQTMHVPPKTLDRVLAVYKKQFPRASPWDRYLYITTDAGFGAHSVVMADRKAMQGGAPVYLYRFDYETTKLGGQVRAMHGMELPFVFDTVRQTSWMVDDTPQTNALATQISGAWAAFARSGDPNTGALPHWPPYAMKDRSTMLFNLTSRVESDGVRPLPWGSFD